MKGAPVTLKDFNGQSANVIHVTDEDIAEIVNLMIKVGTPEALVASARPYIKGTLELLYHRIFIDASTGTLCNSLIKDIGRAASVTIERMTRGAQLQKAVERVVEKMMNDTFAAKASALAPAIEKIVSKELSDFVEHEAADRARSMLNKRIDEIAARMLATSGVAK